MGQLWVLILVENRTLWLCGFPSARVERHEGSGWKSENSPKRDMFCHSSWWTRPWLRHGRYFSRIRLCICFVLIIRSSSPKIILIIYILNGKLCFSLIFRVTNHSYAFIQAPRGLSAEEKRVKLIEIFHETVRNCIPFWFMILPAWSIRKTFFRYYTLTFGTDTRNWCIRGAAEGIGETGAKIERNRWARYHMWHMSLYWYSI